MGSVALGALCHTKSSGPHLEREGMGEGTETRSDGFRSPLRGRMVVGPEVVSHPEAGASLCSQSSAPPIYPLRTPLAPHPQCLLSRLARSLPCQVFFGLFGSCIGFQLQPSPGQIHSWQRSRHLICLGQEEENTHGFLREQG